MILQVTIVTHNIHGKVSRVAIEIYVYGINVLTRRRIMHRRLHVPANAVSSAVFASVHLIYILPGAATAEYK